MIECNGELCSWVVYARPSDFPNEYVARLFHLDRPTHVHIEGDSLEEIRFLIDKLHPGLTCLSRMPEDDPTIVEMWL